MNTRFLYKLLNASQFELDSDRVYDYYLPKDKTVIVTSRLFVLASKAAQMALNTVVIESAEVAATSIPGDINRCLVRPQFSRQQLSLESSSTRGVY
jgi:hypothetical protein